jgi:hypothetical protein
MTTSSGEWPTPPTNVRVVSQRGDEVPVECVYVGKDLDGTDMWEAVTEIDPSTITSLRMMSYRLAHQ